MADWTPTDHDSRARDVLAGLAAETGLAVSGGKVRRTSSRFCLGVEHGDYNGTELFGVGTDRFIWLAYKANNLGRVRLFSGNFPGDGVVEFAPGDVPPPRSLMITDTWARYPFGVDYVLRREGFPLTRGFDAVVHGNIPGGGMSRSASLCLNLILTCLEVNGLVAPVGMRVVELAQAVENEYVGSPCGNLDQVMIQFARAGMGTHYNPNDRSVRHVPLGPGAIDFRLVSLDTGTARAGLEKSTYKIRRAECEELVALAGEEFGITCLAEVRDCELHARIVARFGASHAELCARLNYIFHAQQRFGRMLEAWKDGKVEEAGAIFRQDGLGLRDDYQISGPELETMCAIARTVPGVLGERMLGGGDKGAAGAIVRAESVGALRAAVDAGYPRRWPALADKYAVHECRMVDGVVALPGL